MNDQGETKFRGWLFDGQFAFLTCVLAGAALCVGLSVAQDVLHDDPIHIWGEIVLPAISGVIIGAAICRLRQKEHRHRRALGERERRIQSYLDVAAVMIVALDSAGHVVLINNEGCNIFGFEEQDILGKDWFANFLPEEQRASVRQVFDQLIRGDIEPVTYYENEILNSQGQVRTIAWHNAVLRDAAGQIESTLASGTDITERKRAEKALKQSRAFLRTVIDSIPEGLMVINRDHTVAMTNRTSRASAGVDPVADGLTCHQVSHGSSSPCSDNNHPCPLQMVVETGESVRLEHVHCDDRGRKIFVELLAAPIFDDAGDVAQIVEICHDVTERRNADELKNCESIVSNSLDLMALVDCSFTYITANGAYAKALARSKDEIVGHTVADVLGEQMFNDVVRDSAERCLAGETIQYSKWVDLPGSGRRLLNMRYSPHLKNGHTIEGYVVSARDMTDFHRAQEGLEASEERFRMLSEQSVMGILILQDDAYVYVNRAAADIFGYSIREMLGWPAKEYLACVHPDDRAFAAEQARRKQAGEDGAVAQYDCRLITQAGEEKWITIYSKTVNFNGHPADMVTLADITGKKQIERRYEELFREMLNGFALHEVICNEAGEPVDYRFLAVNQAFERMTGLKGVDIIGKTVLEVLPGTECRWVESYGKVALSGEPALLEDYSSELEKHFEVTAFQPAYGQFACIFDDVTDRKRAERLLIQSEKLASLGTLVAGIAHEINNPNMFIMMNTGVLKEFWDSVMPLLKEQGQSVRDALSGGESLEDIEKVAEKAFGHVFSGADRIKLIVDELKHYARDESRAEPANIAVNDVARSATTLLSNRIKTATDYFETDYADDLPVVKLQAQRLEQVLINLLSNSCDAIADRSKAIVVATSHDRDSRTIIIRVEDQGVGMEQGVLDHIMDPFFTTKRDVGGTGLGLSISSRIIADMGGSLVYESTPGRGTIATISLPLATEGDI